MVLSHDTYSTIVQQDESSTFIVFAWIISVLLSRGPDFIHFDLEMSNRFYLMWEKEHRNKLFVFFNAVNGVVPLFLLRIYSLKMET